jgi:predicted Rdx family selenoprotein
LAADLKKNFGIDAELKPGHGGIFDVEVDGTKIYSKHDTHRFPHPGEVDELIAGRGGT